MEYKNMVCHIIFKITLHISNHNQLIDCIYFNISDSSGDGGNGNASGNGNDNTTINPNNTMHFEPRKLYPATWKHIL